MNIPSASDRAFITAALIKQIEALWPECSISGVALHNVPMEIVEQGENIRVVSRGEDHEEFTVSDMHGIRFFS